MLTSQITEKYSTVHCSFLQQPLPKVGIVEEASILCWQKGGRHQGGYCPYYIGSKPVINQDLERAISRMEHLNQPLAQIYAKPSLASGVPPHTQKCYYKKREVLIFKKWGPTYTEVFIS